MTKSVVFVVALAAYVVTFIAIGLGAVVNSIQHVVVTGIR